MYYDHPTHPAAMPAMQPSGQTAGVGRLPYGLPWVLRTAGVVGAAPAQPPECDAVLHRAQAGQPGPRQRFGRATATRLRLAVLTALEAGCCDAPSIALAIKAALPVVQHDLKLMCEAGDATSQMPALGAKAGAGSFRRYTLAPRGAARLAWLLEVYNDMRTGYAPAGVTMGVLQ